VSKLIEDLEIYRDRKKARRDMAVRAMNSSMELGNLDNALAHHRRVETLGEVIDTIETCITIALRNDG
jgi:hypothetical protein